MLLFEGELARSLEKRVEQLGFDGHAGSFERSGESDKLCGQVCLRRQSGKVRSQNRLLSFAAQAAGNASPEYIELKLVALARVLQSVRMNPPELVDPGFVALTTKSRAQKITGENQPGLLVIDGLLATGEASVERTPEGTD